MRNAECGVRNETRRRAAGDDHVHALVLHVGDVAWGWAKVAEMREALQRHLDNFNAQMRPPPAPTTPPPASSPARCR